MPEILNKKQLEDVAECLTRFHERTCGQCSCNKFRYGYVGSYGCTENAAKTALAYREMLERLEWSMPEDRWGGDYCPMCGNSDLEGHTADCELAALLKEREAEYNA